MIDDDHDATKAKFDALVRDLAAEHTSRTTAANVTPPTPDRRPHRWDERMVVRVAAALILIAIAAGGIAWALLAAHV